MSKKEYVNCDDCGTGLVMAERIVGSVLICHCEQCYQQLKAENKKLIAGIDKINNVGVQLRRENKRLDKEIGMLKEIVRHYCDSSTPKDNILNQINSELAKKVKRLEERIELAVDYLPESPNKAIAFLTPALKGDVK